MTTILTHTHTPGPATKAAQDALTSLDHAVPYATTFLFLSPGCGAVGQGTPLATAIEQAMEGAFRNWERTWIRPRLEEVIAKDASRELLEALKATKRWMSGYGTKTQSEMREEVHAAIAKAEGR